MKKTVKLKFLWKTKTLRLFKSEYACNWKDYYWLLTRNWEPFSDITVNLPNEDILKDYNFVDRDFINICFSDVSDCEKRLRENLNIKHFHPYWDYYYFTF
jgi:hypothetical protein